MSHDYIHTVLLSFALLWYIPVTCVPTVTITCKKSANPGMYLSIHPATYIPLLSSIHSIPHPAPPRADTNTSNRLAPAQNPRPTYIHSATSVRRAGLR
ncbi:hypothetical protein BZA77DRAFT_132298 [Pyronema omphalodes]|nr:hypothetical protein BZA77DRAFT_132298 [Pyronema omphalodes]